VPVACVAVLRGINVGGKNKIRMQDLSAVFAAAGCSRVRTYIQSGNVAFTAPLLAEHELRAVLEQQILDRFGFRVPVVLRRADELARVLAGNPFPEAASHVMFLADTPSQSAVDSLDPNRSPGDSFSVQGRDIFLHLPNGVAESKLTNAYFDSKLATVSTLRNWRTVRALADLAAAL